MTTERSIKNWRRQDLCYCSNVHALQSEHDLVNAITGLIAGVRRKRQLQTMSAGLWLNVATCRAFTSSLKKMRFLKELLAQNGIYLLTLNGFPYDAFHADIVKERVYSPDWSDPARHDYTVKLAEILAFCLPEHTIEGTISTLPLGFRHRWSAEKHDKALEALCVTAFKLSQLRNRTGKSIRLCLEMEPDCVLESTDETISFFQQSLSAKAKQLGIQQIVLQRHLGICFDICHQAVMFEDISDSLERFLAADITIGKIQISSALEISQPATEHSQSLMRQFAEPKYLHQVRTRHRNQLYSSLDLSTALENQGFPNTSKWRVHFHVPVQAETLVDEALTTTQKAIGEVLDFLKSHPQCRPHLEVETYTWQVLPKSVRPDSDASLVDGLATELIWLEKAMREKNLISENDNA